MWQIQNFLYVKLYDFALLIRGTIFKIFFSKPNFHCSFCNESFRIFLPNGHKNPILEEKKIVGGGYRKNAKCPNCDSIDRERSVHLFLEKNELIKKESIILHVAPEKNLQKYVQKKTNQYVSIDLNSPFASIRMDIVDLKFDNEYFTGIICNHVLEHIPNDIKAIKELYRVLKPECWAILQVPYSPILEYTYEDSSITKPSERLLHYGQSDHLRIYGNDFIEKLVSVGFKVKTQKIDSKTIDKYSLIPQEVIFYALKN